uniref:MD-2-related lipid-recognition domain-containing protein n=1 Tax=Anopheles coluzzii TaxID=1518534 RepID=A0A6E8W1M7_ANOCL
MSSCGNFIKLLVLLVVFLSSTSIAKLVPVIARIDSTFNAQLSNSSITLLTEGPQGRRRIPEFTVSIQTYHSVSEAWLNGKLTISTKNGRISQPIIDTTVSFCDLLQNPQKYHVMSLVYFEIRRYGRAPDRCPIAPGLYVYPNVSLKRTQIPSFLLDSDFVVEVSGTTGSARNQFVNVKAYGSLKRF